MPCGVKQEDIMAKTTVADKTTRYSEIANSPKFKALIAQKKSFIIPITLFFFAFYFTLPIMTSKSELLNKPALGAITWAWVFAFAQFVMTWALCIIYAKRAAGFDVLAAEIVQEASK